MHGYSIKINLLMRRSTGTIVQARGGKRYLAEFKVCLGLIPIYELRGVLTSTFR
jgi:hypothetical protein